MFALLLYFGLFCPRVCLLDLSRLLGLTLGPSVSCLLLPPRFLDTREAGIEAGSRACFFSYSSFSSARDGLCPVISDSLRGMSLQALLKFEVFLVSAPFLHHLCRVRLGALQKYCLILR